MELNSDFLSDSIEHHTNCELYLLKNIISDVNIARALAKELEILDFEHTHNDLHSFKQTVDFSNIEKLPHHVKNFQNVICTKMKKVVENLYNVKVKDGVTMTASSYNKGDYLLCHDDLCGDRLIAFVFYLTENWTESDGGKLRFFNYDGEQKDPSPDSYREEFVPSFNSLVLFKVSNTSYHEVQEVFSNKARLSINGWFHYSIVDSTPDSCQEKHEAENVQACLNAHVFYKSSLYQFNKYNNDLSKTRIKDLMNQLYLHTDNLNEVMSLLKMRTVVLSQQFLNGEFYNRCIDELQRSDLNWVMKGPANRRKYEVLEVIKDGNLVQLGLDLPYLNLLLNFLTSQYWLSYLNMVTGREFIVTDERYVPPVCMAEVQRWRKGHYSLLTDDDFLNNTANVEVTVFFQVHEELVDKVGQADSVEETSVEETSGRVVQIVKDLFPLQKYDCVSRAKKRRIEKENNITVIRSQLEFKKCCRLTRIVQQKMQQLIKYRKSLQPTPPKHNFITPTNNSVLILLNTERTSKFASYIKHLSAEGDGSVMYYAVTMNYLIQAD